MPPAGAGWVPQHHRDITLGRLDGFLAANQFADRNLRADLWTWRSGEAEGSVSLQVYSHPKDEPYPKYEDAVRMPYRPAHVGDSFGPSWTTHWFRVRVRVPPDWDGLGPLMFRWDSGSEAMLYTDGPTPRQGITDQRNEYLLADVAAGGQELEFYVEMAANGMFGTGTDIQPPDENRYFTLKAAELAIPNVAVTALFHDLRALVGLARELPPGNSTGEAALYTANKIVNTYRAGDAESVNACREVAASVLSVRDPGERLQVHAVGHCHIDTAWLWPFSETHRKTARSWSAQLRLAERYPWHVFTASSAQQYEWLLQDYPGLFAEIQRAAERGNFVPVGGTWVEMDTNLPSGESLVRQFLYGQRFFQEHFGAQCDVFWLPDTFGYSGQLPQIASGAGIQYFLTQKLSWNNINSFPHTTFYWAGLDGSRLLTHFPPANTYNAQADARDILLTATGSKDKDRAPAAYMLYGNGDGGGGPTVDMCESLSRLAGCRGLASLSVTSPGEFFRRLEADSQDLLTWRGELYFELHRGTYTSHAANKSDNRTCELLLREAEAAGALAVAVLPPGTYTYPRAQVDALWKDVLLFQFHDVLPGSAIGRVYGVTAQRYPEIKSKLRKIRDEALAAVLAALATRCTHGPPAAAAIGSLPYVAAVTVFPGAKAVTPETSPTGPDSLARLSLAEVAGARPLPGSQLQSLGFEAGGSSSAAGGQESQRIRPAWPGRQAEEGAEGRGAVCSRGTAISPAVGAAPASVSASAPAAATGVTETAVTSDSRPGAQHAFLSPVAWVFNSLAFARREVVALPVQLLKPGTSARQLSADRKSALVVVAAPPLTLVPVESQDLEAGFCIRGGDPHGVDLGLARGEVETPTRSGGKSSAAQQPPQSQTTLKAGELRQGHVAELPPRPTGAAGRDPWVGPGATVRRVDLRAAAAQPGSGRDAGIGGTSAAGGSGAGSSADGGPGGRDRDGLIYVMQNSMVRATFNSAGHLVSLYDMAWQRELLPHGSAGNVFKLYEDIPLFWDAWDIEIYHLEKGWLAGQGMAPPQVEILESGPVRCQLGVQVQLSPSASLKQVISLTAISPRIDFHCEVEWGENRRCLKVEFPWQLDAPSASYEVQYGAVERPTHTNTSWDWARFEVCAHKWADLSEPGYGVALLNDCKYGHATHGNVMRLSLLRSPKAPDAFTDMGSQAFRFAVLPHARSWAAAGVVAHGWAFNAPMRVLPPVPPSPPPPPPPHATLPEWEHRLRSARLNNFDPSQPMFTVSSARPNPLLAVDPHSAAANVPSLVAPPLILETIKLPEPPLQAHVHSQAADCHTRHYTAYTPQFPGHLQNFNYGRSAPTPGPADRHTVDLGFPVAGGEPSALVLRLYEPHGARGLARVTWPGWLRVTHVARCNLLEEDEGGQDGGAGAEGPLTVRLSDAGGSVDVPYRPFKVITLKLYLEQ